MRDLEKVVQVYAEAWNERDRARRLLLLESCWVDDGVFIDPRVVISGREPLADYMPSFRVAQPGARSELTSGVDEHHGRFRVGWQVVGLSDTPVVAGVDFGEVAPDGRIAWITSFEGSQ